MVTPNPVRPDAQLIDLVTRELHALAQAGASPWAHAVGGAGPLCFGCGDRGRCAVVCEGAFRELVQAGADRLGGAPDLGGVPQDLAGYIDHTLLKPGATADQVQTLCREAAHFHFASVCINPIWVSTAAELLAGTSVKVCTVIGFPLGANAPRVKAYEAQQAVADGAHEVDMVLNVGALKSGFDEVVERDIRGVVQAAGPRVVTKVILETALLDDAEKIRACEAAKCAGADFVKTSTGFGPGGATAGDIALMRRLVGSRMGVKASGGVRTQQDALRMIRSGASRIGASASVKIVDPGVGAGASPGGY